MFCWKASDVIYIINSIMFQSVWWGRIWEEFLNQGPMPVTSQEGADLPYKLDLAPLGLQTLQGSPVSAPWCGVRSFHDISSLTVLGSSHSPVPQYVICFLLNFGEPQAYMSPPQRVLTGSLKLSSSGSPTVTFFSTTLFIFLYDTLSAITLLVCLFAYLFIYLCVCIYALIIYPVCLFSFTTIYVLWGQDLKHCLAESLACSSFLNCPFSIICRGYLLIFRT